MKNLKYIGLLLTVFVVALAGSAVGNSSQFSNGVFRIVGDLRTYNNDPFSDFNTAIGEESTVFIDGSAGAIEFGAGDTTAPDVVLGRDGANRLHLGAGDSFVMEGTTADAFEIIIAPGDPTADRTITLPDASANVGRIRVTCTMLLIADMVDQSCFVADRVYTLISINAVWKVQESGGTLTVLTRKQEGTEAAASGQLLQAAAMNVVATAETTTTPALSSTGADLIFAAGDRIGIDFTDDTAGELAGLVITFVLDPS